jgi:hypothetical protein
MLSWTEAGAVRRPTTLQIRVQRRYPGRVRAGAPTPTRSLSRAEILANLLHFTDGQRGPRTTPCTGLVLSGVGLLSSEDTAPVLREARRLGIVRSVLHAGAEDLGRFAAEPWRSLVDVLVVPLQPDAGHGLDEAADAVAACRAAGIQVAVNTVLSAAAIRDLDQVARLAAGLAPDSCTFSFPFPTGAEQPPPPAPAVVLPDLERAVATLQAAGSEPRIKGLPACYLGPLADLLQPSTNRFYVDADHQLDDALMFFPHVLAFHKGEACRFCSRDGRCDGFFSAWLRLPGFPPLEPVQER